MHEALEIIVSGRVQLVMYRDYATRNARKLKLFGDVKNLSDGTVRVRVEGPGERLALFVEKLKRGSVLSNVKNIEIFPADVTNLFSTFTITYEA